MDTKYRIKDRTKNFNLYVLWPRIHTFKTSVMNPKILKDYVHKEIIDGIPEYQKFLTVIDDFIRKKFRKTEIYHTSAG